MNGGGWARLGGTRNGTSALGADVVRDSSSGSSNAGQSLALSTTVVWSEAGIAKVARRYRTACCRTVAGVQGGAENPSALHRGYWAKKKAS